MAACPPLEEMVQLLAKQVLTLDFSSIDVACTKMLVSKVLGYAIVTGAAIVKVPQILKIMKAKSVSGMAASTILTEMVATISSFCYYVSLGYPFSTWGENLFLFLQNIVMTVLFFHYTVGATSPRARHTYALCAMIGYVLYTKRVPDLPVPPALCAALGLRSCTLTSSDIAGGLPIILMQFSRLPQVMQNFKQGHAGQLAFITYAMNTLGALARIFTTMQELDDPITLFSCSMGFVQNFILCAQIVVLGNAPDGKERVKTKRSPKKKE